MVREVLTPGQHLSCLCFRIRNLIETNQGILSREFNKKSAFWELKHFLQSFFMFLHVLEDLELHFKHQGEHLEEWLDIEDQSASRLSYRWGWISGVVYQWVELDHNHHISCPNEPYDLKFLGKVTMPQIMICVKSQQYWTTYGEMPAKFRAVVNNAVTVYHAHFYAIWSLLEKPEVRTVLARTC